MEPPKDGGSTSTKSASNIQKLKEEFGTEEEAEGRGVPVVVEVPVHRRMSVIAFIGHFCVQRELFGEHVIGAPAESPGEVVAGGDVSRRYFHRSYSHSRRSSYWHRG